jgi:hypothetical protein
MLMDEQSLPEGQHIADACTFVLYNGMHVLPVGQQKFDGSP